MAGEAAMNISVQNVIELIDSATWLIGIFVAGFSAVGVVAVWRAEKSGMVDYFRMFERVPTLQLLTVMVVIASATILALLGVLDSNGITGILSGVAGYVLGGLNKYGQQVDSGSGPNINNNGNDREMSKPKEGYQVADRSKVGSPQSQKTSSDS